jgi:hypothetical protein|tara:strand:- start:1957 stop:2862 length:906 start_codon:yes stop_codon:yes gene_type:complete
MSDAYHQYDGKSLTRSQLWMFYNKGPLAFYNKYIAGVREVESAALIEGQAFHALTLEGEQAFHDNFCSDFQTPAAPLGEHPVNYWKRKEPKAELLKLKSQWALDNSHKKILKPESIARIMEMREAAWDQTNTLCFAALHGAETEVEFERFDNVSGMVLRSRVDILNNNQITDLKSHSGNFELDWDRAVEKYGYWFQSAFYQYTTGVSDLHFLVVEKKRSPQAALFCLDSETQAFSTTAFVRALARFDSCRSVYDKCLQVDDLEERDYLIKKAWPGAGTSQTQLKTTGLSPWFMKREEERYG